eukprot:1160987-Pelagomonas_calceolata.AAC.6
MGLINCPQIHHFLSSLTNCIAKLPPSTFLSPTFRHGTVPCSLPFLVLYAADERVDTSMCSLCEMKARSGSVPDGVQLWQSRGTQILAFGPMLHRSGAWAPVQAKAQCKSAARDHKTSPSIGLWLRPHEGGTPFWFMRSLFSFNHNKEDQGYALVLCAHTPHASRNAALKRERWQVFASIYRNVAG